MSPKESIICTDQQSSDRVGAAVVEDYIQAATRLQSTFISVILQCSEEENVKRLSGRGRKAGATTKLTSSDVLLAIRKTEDIYKFRNDSELVLDVSSLSPGDAAACIYNFVMSN